jgi:transposase
LVSDVKEDGAVTMSEQYPSDLTDGQWQVIRGLLPKPAQRGPKPICRRWIINAIFYLNRTGCQWRALPHDFPKWKTVSNVFWQWRRNGLWERIHDALRRRVRRQAGKKPTPSAAILDSQSIRT